MNRGFGVERVVDADRLVVKVRGEIDLMTAGTLRDELVDAVKQSPEVMVDLSEVGFLDSTGVRSLFDAYRAAGELGHRFYVSGSRQWVAKVLDVTGVGKLLAPPG